MKYSTSVVSGHGRGKFLGYPTLNLVVPKKLSRKFGIYAGKVFIDGNIYKGAFHYGPVPTFKQNTVSLEVFVLDTDIKDTPKKVEIELIEYLREIVSFPSEESLINQITKDVIQVNNLVSVSNNSN